MHFHLLCLKGIASESLAGARGATWERGQPMPVPALLTLGRAAGARRCLPPDYTLPLCNREWALASAVGAALALPLPSGRTFAQRSRVWGQEHG